MDIIQIQKGIILVRYVTAFLMGGVILLLSGIRAPVKVLSGTRQFTTWLRSGKQFGGWYRQMDTFLKKKGAIYHFGKRFGPGMFALLELAGGAVGVIVGAALGPLYGILSGVIMVLLPGLLLEIMNKRDNEVMLPDLYLVYNLLATSVKAGVYVTDAMSELFTMVKSERLRDNLSQLSGDLVLQSDVIEALERFSAGFDNPYIDSLCITVIQSLESGQASSLLTDLAEQIREMDGSVRQKKKGRLDRSLTFYQLGLLTAVLGIVIYACVSYMLGSALQF